MKRDKMILKFEIQKQKNSKRNFTFNSVFSTSSINSEKKAWMGEVGLGELIIKFANFKGVVKSKIPGEVSTIL